MELDDTDAKRSRRHVSRSSAILANGRWFCEHIALPVALALIANWHRM